MTKQDFNKLEEKREHSRKMRMKELSKYVGIPKSTLYLYIKQGKFQGIKVSEKVVVYDLATVEKALFGEVA
ncbi:helix-turn-helix transcriptional regulator [Aliarcobacter butzleri]|uniref:helix-turn-helix transcriptional regulator n=1 Tax=Aliarcobacter butzleri TaxID=28197 RepID=UPI0024DE65E3|nr:AlpA family phage regulatory protein [Aliarcobacter butzleri]MDK2084413.1 AlpA family phage regulatory protein [Aliarcobacter butzleri]MDK2090573.1 AlpA family phage regulatory protein [Aliarcobacter butzleri]